MALTFFIDACLVSFYVFERTENKKYLLIFYAAMGFAGAVEALNIVAKKRREARRLEPPQG